MKSSTYSSQIINIFIRSMELTYDSACGTFKTKEYRTLNSVSAVHIPNLYFSILHVYLFIVAETAFFINSGSNHYN